MKESYGGFLPFELKKRKLYYEYATHQMQFYNSGKTASYFAIQQLRPKRLWVPLYLCPTLKNALANTGIPIIYYHINNCLDELDINFQDGDALFLVNYFGIYSVNIQKWLNRKVPIIIDNCQAFYQQPILQKDVLNIYSFKKFFGVPDGAMIIGWETEKHPLEPENAIVLCDYLLGSLTDGTDRWRARKKEVDNHIASSKKGMSDLTYELIHAIDYESVKDKRIKNYQYYRHAFSEINQIKPDPDAVPYLYPLNVRKDIREKLVQEKIYVPLLWADTAQDIYKGTTEHQLSRETIFLPLDQRYTSEDILYIISKVKELLK